MNTIKIYFDTDGSIRELKKDFNLYQGQFHDKLLNAYVPTSVLAPDFVVENEQGQTIEDFVASTSVKAGIKYVARDGSLKVSKSYFLNFLKVMTQNGVEYAVFERKLPKEFTTYNGQGANAPMLVLNVVNLDLDSETPTILSVITTQECFLDVLPSASLDNDDAVEPSELEVVNAEINGVKKSLFEQSTEIADVRNEVSEINDRIETGETPIGKMEGDTLPTDEQINDFVVATVAREPKLGDYVIFVLNGEVISHTFKYLYSESGWIPYEITTVQKAQNSTYGLVKGTYTNNNTADVLLDIDNGEVRNIYVKDCNNAYQNLREYLCTIQTNYMTKVEGATKQYVQDYAMPKQFASVYFATADGYGDQLGVSADPISTSTAVSVTEEEITPENGLALDTEATFDLSILNGYRNTFWVEPSADCDPVFVLVTTLKKVGQEPVELNRERSEQYHLTGGNVERINFENQFLSLADTTVNVEEGDKIIQQLYAEYSEAERVTFDLYSYDVYPSTFTLITANFTPLGATTVLVNGSPVSTFNADTKMSVTPSTIEVGNSSQTSTTVELQTAENNMQLYVEEAHDNVSDMGQISLLKGSFYVSLWENGAMTVFNKDIKTFGIVRINNGTITYTNNTGTFSLNGGVSATGDLSTSGTMSVNGCILSYNPTSQKFSITDNTHVGGDVDINGKFIINGVNSNAEISYAGGDSDPVTINKKLAARGIVATNGGDLAIRISSGEVGFSWDGYGLAVNTKLGVPYGFRNNNNSSYAAKLPNMDSWTADKTLATIDMVYPIGSIYLSVANTNPSTLFGGTWEQLKDRFLLGAGDTYNAGDTDGSATHYHQTAIALADGGTSAAVVLKADPYNRGTTIGGSTSLRTTAMGEDASFGNTKPTTTNNASNMPPYLVVYMWKRTA